MSFTEWQVFVWLFRKCGQTFSVEGTEFSERKFLFRKGRTQTQRVLATPKFSMRQILALLIAYLTLDRKCFPYQYFDMYRKL